MFDKQTLRLTMPEMMKNYEKLLYEQWLKNALAEATPVTQRW